MIELEIYISTDNGDNYTHTKTMQFSDPKGLINRKADIVARVEGLGVKVKFVEIW